MSRINKPRRFLRITILIAGLLLSFSASLVAQEASDQQQSLGDLARKSKQEKQSKEHKAAKKILDDDNPPPHSGRYSNYSYCRTVPCAELWFKIPEQMNSGYVGKVQLVPGPKLTGEDLESAEETFMSRSLVAPWRLGAVPEITSEEDTRVGGQPAVLVRFTFTKDHVPNVGLALLVQAPEQVMSMACVFKKADFDEGSQQCQDIVDSADVKLPKEYKVFNPPSYAYQYTNGYDDP